MLQGWGSLFPLLPRSGDVHPHHMLTARLSPQKSEMEMGRGPGRGEKALTGPTWPSTPTSAFGHFPPHAPPPRDRREAPHRGEPRPTSAAPSHAPSPASGGQLVERVVPWRVGPESWPCPLEGCHPPAVAGEGCTPFLGQLSDLLEPLKLPFEAWAQGGLRCHVPTATRALRSLWVLGLSSVSRGDCKRPQGSRRREVRSGRTEAGSGFSR